jgi:anaerobic selenocysteine-containing dehydrogenase
MRVPLALGRAPLGPPVPNPRPVDIDLKPTTDELMELEAADARIPLAEVRRHPSGHVFDEARRTVAPRRDDAARFDLAPPLFLDDLAAVAAEPVVAGGGYRPGDRYTHRLASRRLRQVFNSTGSHLSALNGRGPGNPAYLGSRDMAALGLSDGDLVEIESEHGRIVGVARTDEGVAPGVVSMAHSWGGLPGEGDIAEHPEAGACTNLLVANDRDFEPLIGQCRQSAIPVNLRPVARTPREETAR